MNPLKPSRRPRLARRNRPARTRPLLERLEDRTLLAGGEWVLRLEGLSGTTLAD
jgi:hypothetical protein